MMLVPSTLPAPDFASAADLVLSLGELTAAARSRLGITSAVQAKQIGISKATLTRLESGGAPTQSTIVATLRWLATH